MKKSSRPKTKTTKRRLTVLELAKGLSYVQERLHKLETVDIHKLRAAEYFAKKPEDVDARERMIGKSLNHADSYVGNLQKNLDQSMASGCTPFLRGRKFVGGETAQEGPGISYADESDAGASIEKEATPYTQLANVHARITRLGKEIEDLRAGVRASYTRDQDIRKMYDGLINQHNERIARLANEVAKLKEPLVDVKTQNGATMGVVGGDMQRRAYAEALGESLDGSILFECVITTRAGRMMSMTTNAQRSRDILIKAHRFVCEQNLKDLYTLEIFRLTATGRRVEYPPYGVPRGHAAIADAIRQLGQLTPRQSRWLIEEVTTQAQKLAKEGK